MLSFLCFYLARSFYFPLSSLHEKVCWMIALPEKKLLTLCGLPVILFCFDFLCKQHINCVGALRYHLQNQLHASLLVGCM